MKKIRLSYYIRLEIGVGVSVPSLLSAACLMPEYHHDVVSTVATPCSYARNSQESGHYIVQPWVVRAHRYNVVSTL